MVLNLTLPFFQIFFEKFSFLFDNGKLITAVFLSSKKTAWCDKFLINIIEIIDSVFNDLTCKTSFQKLCLILAVSD